MPLLRTSLLVLLLLPLSLSLSCDTIRPPTDVSEDYKATVHTDLGNAEKNITASLQTISCPKKTYRLQNCTPSDVEVVIVSKLHSLTCKMKNLGLPNTDSLAKTVLYSIRCPCPKRPDNLVPDKLRQKRDDIDIMPLFALTRGEVEDEEDGKETEEERKENIQEGTVQS